MSNRRFVGHLCNLGVSLAASVALLASPASAQTLVGHWKMDEGGGGAVADSSGNGNDGALFGNPTFVAGKDNGALSLDGNTGTPTSVDYARIPDHASLDITGPITLSAWVNPARTATQSVLRKVDGTGIGTAVVAAYEIELSADHFVSVRFNGDETKRVDSNYIYDNCPQATCPSCPPGGCTNLNTWFHVAATYDGATIRLYINGVLDQSLTGAFTINSNDVDLTLGADVSGSDARDLQGLLDDVRIYSGALSAAQTSELFCVGNPGASCEDGQYCNGADTCSGGSCSSHTGDPCIGGGECADACNETDDTCNEPAGTPCGSGGDTACDNPDTCNGAGGCQANPEPATTVCRAQTGECDIAELCDGVGGCPEDGWKPDGTSCDDSLYCTVLDQCTGGECGGTARDCSASGDQCRVGECNETSDQCEGPAKPDGTACDDGNDCTVPDTCLAGECSGVPDSLACLDDFSCYKAKTTSGTTKFPGVPSVTLADAFAVSTAAVKKTKLLCAPADRNEQDPAVPDHPDHLHGYQLKPAAKFAGAMVSLTDPFGPLSVLLVKPWILMVPMAKSLSSPPSPPVDPIPDHFQCYKAKVLNATATLPVTGIVLEDQFGQQTAEAMKVKQVCVPVDTNDGDPGAGSNTGHLVCYQQRSQPKFVKRSPVFTANQLGSEHVDVLKPALLCLAATRTE